MKKLIKIFAYFFLMSIVVISCSKNIEDNKYELKNSYDYQFYICEQGILKVEMPYFDIPQPERILMYDASGSLKGGVELIIGGGKFRVQDWDDAIIVASENVIFTEILFKKRINNTKVILEPTAFKRSFRREEQDFDKFYIDFIKNSITFYFDENKLITCPINDLIVHNLRISYKDLINDIRVELLPTDVRINEHIVRSIFDRKMTKGFSITPASSKRDN